MQDRDGSSPQPRFARLRALQTFAIALAAAGVGALVVGIAPVSETGLTGHLVAGAVAGGLGFACAWVFWRVWRRRVSAGMMEQLAGLLDGIALFDRGGRRFDDPQGILQPYASHAHSHFVERLTADIEQVAGEDPDEAGEAIERLRGARTVQLDARMRDGRTLTLRQARVANGPTVVVAQDTSETVARNEELARLSRRYQELTEIASDWMWETDRQHRFTEIAGRFMEQTGFDESVLLGRRLLEVADLRSDPAVFRELNRLMREHEPIPGVYCPLRLPGANHVVRFRIAGYPVFADDGRFVGYRGVAADVTQQHAAEAEARNAKQVLKDAIAAASEGIALYARDGSFVMCNRKLANDFAPVGHQLYEGGTLAGLITDLISGGQLRFPADHRLATVESLLQEIRRGAMRREFIGGKDRWYRLSANRSADDGTVLIFTDISELKTHEASLAARIAELQRTKTELEDQKQTLSELADHLAAARNLAETANRAKSEFLAAISHELRTPLNAIIGFSDIMQQEAFGPLGSERYRDYAGDIHESGQHLLTLINNILDLSKAEAGRLEINREPVDLQQIVDLAIRIACPRAGDAKITVDIDDDTAEIDADAQKLKQILINLISNAAKFTPSHGSITIAARRIGPAAELVVADTGIGMREEDIPNALTAFRQIDSSLGRKYEGTGLGLPLAQKFAELHGGTLAIQSKLGAGTTVTVSIPQRSAASAAVA